MDVTRRRQRSLFSSDERYGQLWPEDIYRHLPLLELAGKQFFYSKLVRLGSHPVSCQEGLCFEKRRINLYESINIERRKRDAFTTADLHPCQATGASGE